MYSKDSGNGNATLYAKDNLISRYKIAGTNTRYVDYTYDTLNRLDKKSLALNGKSLVSSYTYADDVKYTGDYTTNFVETEKLDNITYKYYYDCESNIKEIEKNFEKYLEYGYDLKNQLTSETNHLAKTKTGFTYDDLGNITSKVEYDYSKGTVKNTIAYNYGKDSNAGWNHILTSVDFDGDSEISENEKIKYDAIGNPTTYLGASLSWNGRELKSYNGTVDGVATKVTYTYDADGLRGTKTVNKNNVDTKHTYHYVSGQLRYEERGTKKLYYFYDASGNLSAIRYYPDGGTTFYMYYILTNSRGDVEGIYSGSGVLLASYEYDAWGNCKITKDTNGIGELNPIRYRGYYYDSETGLYYLQSRYYNPQVGRFLNADDIRYLGAGEIISCNLFIYCSNNPITGYDPTGYWDWGLFAKIAITTVVVAVCLTGVGAIAASAAAAVTTSVATVVTVSVSTAGITTALSAVDGAICAQQSGGKWYDGFMAGAIGGSAGSLISSLTTSTQGPDTYLRMNTAGRITSSFLYDISYDLFSGKTIGISNFAMYAADVSLDAIIAPVGYYYTSNISNSYLSATINGLVDGIVDIFQTIALFCE